MSSKRLFPKDTKLTIQETNYSDYINDLVYYIDNQVEDIDLNGKKTITIGRISNYEYYFNCLLNEFGNLNGFDIILDFLKNKKFQIENILILKIIII